MNWIWVLLATSVAQYVISEALCLFDVVARWLVRRSVAGLPQNVRARYAQEWEAELEAIPGSGLLRLLFAVRVRLGARATARALGATATRLAFKAQLPRVGFMVGATLMIILLLPITALLAGLIAVLYGRPILRSRTVRARDGRAVTLHSFNFPTSTAVGRFVDAKDLDALPSLVAIARGQIWPTFAQLRIISRDLRNGRPTQPFRDKSP